MARQGLERLHCFKVDQANEPALGGGASSLIEVFLKTFWVLLAASGSHPDLCDAQPLISPFVFVSF